MNEISFTKSELGFIKIFNSCIDNSTVNGEKFNIKAEKGIVHFSQVGSNILNYYKIEKENIVEINIWYSTNFVFNLIRSMKDEDVIKFSDKGEISIMGKGVYKVDSYDFENESLPAMLECINTSEYETLKINELSKLNKIKGFVPTDKDGCDAVGIMNGYFMASDQYKHAIVMTDNDKNLKVFFNFFIIDLITNSKMESIYVKVLEDRNYYLFSFNNTYVFAPIKKYSFPENVFTEKSVSRFYPDTDIIFKKEDMLSALQRMNLITMKENEFRLFFTYNKDSILIESKDSNVKQASEIIEAEVDERLYNESEPYCCILSSYHVAKMVACVDTERVIMKTKPSSIPKEIEVVTFIAEKEILEGDIIITPEMTDGEFLKPDDEMYLIHNVYNNTPIATEED